METPGAGRGRGRGRRPPEQERTPPPAPPPVVRQEVEDEGRGDDMVEELASAMYSSTPSSVIVESERGRSRGRGTLRGRVRGAAVAEAMPQREAEIVQELGERFADLGAAGGEAVGGLPESPKEVVEQPPPAAGDSPPTVVQEPAIRQELELPAAFEGEGGARSSLAAVSSTSASTKKHVGVSEPPVVCRIGTKGEAVPLKANYLRLRLMDNHPGVVEYHVSIEPKIDQVGKRRKLLRTPQCEQVIGHVMSFDGMVLFLPQILPDDVTLIEANFEDEPETKFKIQIHFVKVKLMNDAIIFFNILLRRIMRILGYVLLRQEFYDKEMIEALNQHKMEIWPGLNVSSENQEDGLMICVDTCSRVLRQDTVYDQLVAMKGMANANEKFREFIVNKIVITKYNNKCYKIDDVSWHLQPNSTFTYRGNEVSFVEYLKTKYPDADEVRDMNQPMLVSKLKPRKTDKFQDEERTAALVPQLCHITGLTEDQRNNFKVMTDLAQSTRLVPSQRVSNLNRFIDRLLSNEIVTALLSQWGLTIEREIVELRGRKVEGPNLEFNQRIQLQKAGPDFSREAGKAVYEPVAVRNYVVLCTARDADKAKRFMDVYKEVAGPLGIRMPNLGTIQHIKGMRPSDFSDALKLYCKTPDSVHFVVIIMPMQRDDVYAAIKRYCVSNVPIPSQCIVSKTLGNEKRLRSIVLKIALQINCKLGGSLWALKMPVKEEIMFIGIDSAHDPLKKDPSVICLVASMNNECTKYYSKSSSTKTHMELGESLGPMTLEALKEYRKLRNRNPDRIIVFRDGGSLGALDTISTTEMDSMKRSAEGFCNGDLKNFTFALVTKRIAQRFFAKKGNKVENPEPGTIVDSVVTRRHLYDFYVVSQLVRQGTVNPTHFVIVDKEDPIRPDLIHKLAYVTCFMYYNWSGTVRVPAMVQYAHKLSALLSRHVKSTPHSQISNTLYYL